MSGGARLARAMPAGLPMSELELGLAGLGMVAVYTGKGSALVYCSSSNSVKTEYKHCQTLNVVTNVPRALCRLYLTHCTVVFSPAITAFINMNMH